MPVLAAQGERVSRRIRKPHRRSMNYFGDYGQGLESPRSMIFHEQKIREAVQIPVIRHREHRSDPLQVIVQSLLHHSPVAAGGDDEGMKVNLNPSAIQLVSIFSVNRLVRTRSSPSRLPLSDTIRSSS